MRLIGKQLIAVLSMPKRRRDHCKCGLQSSRMTFVAPTQALSPAQYQPSQSAQRLRSGGDELDDWAAYADKTPLVFMSGTGP